MRLESLGVRVERERPDPQSVKPQPGQQLYGAVMGVRVDDGPQNGQLFRKHLLWLDHRGGIGVCHAEDQDGPAACGEGDRRLQDARRSNGFDDRVETRTADQSLGVLDPAVRGRINRAVCAEGDG